MRRTYLLAAVSLILIILSIFLLNDNYFKWQDVTIIVFLLLALFIAEKVFKSTKGEN